jgi:hypothetical protein
MRGTSRRAGRVSDGEASSPYRPPLAGRVVRRITVVNFLYLRNGEFVPSNKWRYSGLKGAGLFRRWRPTYLRRL